MRTGFALLLLAALAGCAAAPAANTSAAGITVFGDARVGMGYNIDNDGNPALVRKPAGK